MAWFYVKSGGTATGDGGRVTTQRTGSWSVTTSEYYDNLQDALAATTIPTDGDSILCSDLHSVSYNPGAFLIFNTGGAATGAGLAIISVDDANQENYKPGADESLTGSWLFRTENINSFAGISLISDGSGTLSVNSLVPNSRIIQFMDGAIVSTETSSRVIGGSATDGTIINLINVDLDATVLLIGGRALNWKGGASLGIEAPIDAVAINGGFTAYVEGVDLSTSTSLVVGSFDAVTDDVFLIKLTNCQLNASVTLPGDTDFKLPQHRFEMWGCDDSAGGELFRYHMQDGTGKVVNNNSKFVTNENVWSYGGSPEVRSSYEVSTTAICSHVFPFVFNLPLEYIDLANASEDVIRVLVASTLTLTDTELVAYLVYPDGTTRVQPNWITSGKVVSPTGSPEKINYGTDPLAAGTELPTSTAEWTDPGSPQLANKYHLQLDTSVDPGAAGPISVRIEIYRASIVAGELYLATEYEKT